MNQDQVDLLKRALKREKSARKAAEKILEDKSRELYFLSQDLQQANSKLENLLDEKSSQLKGVFENINDAYIVINLNGKILKI
ncbi:PAS domain-containing sensor histidine kinase, partial [Candidatus Woesearchaeota archaeon]|nr:PAS domain-containing sensor histidine kinase [Candidatus Woesearchaeota archaeon]